MFRRFLGILCAGVLRIYFKVVVSGVENVCLKCGGLILISNHRSYLDPVVLECFSKGLKLHFMAKYELFNVPVLKYIIKKLGAFPVRRGLNDLSALEKAEELLSSGKVVAMFPEGKRSKDGELLRPKTGFVRLGVSTGALVVPCSIFYSGKRFRSKLFVSYGKPVNLLELRKDEGCALTFEDCRSLAEEAWDSVKKTNNIQRSRAFLK